MHTLNGPASMAVEKQIFASRLLGEELGGGGEVACITFAHYMSVCLYDPDNGYYRTGGTRVGKAGDFYTSSGVGDLLARAIAMAVQNWRRDTREISERQIVLAEWGAGTGRLSGQLAAVLSESGGGIEKLYRQLLIEDHGGHLEAIAGSYRELGGGPVPQVMGSGKAWEHADHWLGGPTMLIANELLDAFPVHRVTRQSGQLLELGVAGDAESGFRYVRMPVTNVRILEEMERGGLVLEEGATTEVALASLDWITELGKVMGNGRLLIIDYGDVGAELCAPHRREGTLMTYSGHLASDSPFHQPGGRDLTAHVNFTAVTRCAEEAGFDTIYYDTQRQFLVDHGTLGLLASHDGANPFSSEARRNRAIRQLLLSDGMSESFKVLMLEKRR